MGAPKPGTPLGLGARARTDASFSTGAQAEMLSYLKTCTKNKADAGVQDCESSVAAVFGSHPVGLDPEDQTYFEALVTVHGIIGQYEFGWMNIYGDFVTKVTAPTPEESITLFCEYVMDFAFRDVATGEVFSACAGFAAPPEYSNPIPAENSTCPIVDEDYYSTVFLNFPGIGMSVTINALPYSTTSGFISYSQLPGNGKVPTIREWGVLVLVIVLAFYGIWRASIKWRHAHK
jgi:hypothetical protein